MEWTKKPQLMIQDIKTDEWQLFDIRGIRQVNRWKSLIPVDDTVYIAFNDTTIKHFSSTIESKLYLMSELLEQSIHAQYVVLLDLPEDEQSLIKLMQYHSWKRIYAHFYTNESSYFEGLPTRDQFKWYFSFLAKRKTFALKQHIHELSKHTGWSHNTFNFMSKVFFELSFVRIDNGMLVLNENPAKRIYRRHLHTNIVKNRWNLNKNYYTLRMWSLNNGLKSEEQYKPFLRRSKYGFKAICNNSRRLAKTRCQF